MLTFSLLLTPFNVITHFLYYFFRTPSTSSWSPFIIPSSPLLHFSQMLGIFSNCINVYVWFYNQFFSLIPTPSILPLHSSHCHQKSERNVAIYSCSSFFFIYVSTFISFQMFTLMQLPFPTLASCPLDT